MMQVVVSLTGGPEDRPQGFIGTLHLAAGIMKDVVSVK